MKKKEGAADSEWKERQRKRQWRDECKKREEWTGTEKEKRKTRGVTVRQQEQEEGWEEYTYRGREKVNGARENPLSGRNDFAGDSKAVRWLRICIQGNSKHSTSILSSSHR